MTYQVDDAKVIYADLDPKEGVVLHLDTKNYYRLNETGQVIWRALQERVSPETIAQKLTEQFEVAYDEALNDVRSMIHDLGQERLLVQKDLTATREQMTKARQGKTAK